MTLKTTVTFLKGQFGGPPPVPGMGRGYPGYSAIPQGYPGAPNMGEQESRTVFFGTM